MNIILIRHFKTLLNASNQILGWGDAPRADDWQPDLQFVYNKLAATDLFFDAIYTSVLERSYQTGRYFAQAFAVEDLHKQAQLNEVNYGKLYKKSKTWVERHIPEYKTDPAFVFPAGESFLQMQQRSVKCLTSLAHKNPKKTLLLVAHAGVIRALICHFLQLDYASNLKCKISHRYIGHFQFKNKRCCHYNELGHLSGFIKSGVIHIPNRCH